jgi:ribosome biogenesis GTPase
MPDVGTVVARYRRHSLVESSAGERIVCQLKRRTLNPVVGDLVEWHREADGSGIIEGLKDRESVLTRIDARGRPETVAANLSQLVVVLTPRPAPDWFLLDRRASSSSISSI